MDRQQSEDLLYVRRTVLLIGSIGSGSEEVDDLIFRLLALDAISDQPVTLRIDCCGGNVDQGFKLFDTLSQMRAPVTGLVVGECSSMAVVVLQSCKTRLASARSRFLVHGMRCTISYRFGVDANSYLREAMSEELARLQLIYRVFSHRTGKTISEVKQLFKEGDRLELRRSADEALRLKLIDKIVSGPD